MNYVPTTTDPVELRIPRTLAGVPTAPRLDVVCTSDRQQYAVPLDGFTATGLYYAMRADFSALKAPGEYEYHLKDGVILLASGILRVGDVPNPAADTYEIVPKYEQYNAD